MKHRLRQGIYLLCAAGAAVMLLSFPDKSTTGARRGIDICLNILVPSLFPFMVLGVFVVKSGLSKVLGKLLDRPSRFLLHLPGEAAAAVIMSMVGGYPVGARSIAALMENGELTPQQANRMLCFCVNAGPAFLISVVGAGFLRSAAAGFILLAAHLTASLLLGMLCGFSARHEPFCVSQTKPQRTPLSRALVESTQDAAKSILVMCCFVVLFASVLDLSRLFVNTPNVTTVLSGLLEVTGGCADAAKQGAPLWYFSFITGWGGLCVHLQVLSCTMKWKISTARFYLFRLLHGVFSAAITFALSAFLPQSIQVFNTTHAPVSGSLSSTVAAGGALVALCVLFLLQLFPERLLGKPRK